jgi:UDP-GlcNAc:undecaprenyl-phosphate GlcNAc-1-phosphate transferase
MATTLLVMGIPLLDMMWVILQRLRSGQSPFTGDRKHLHYKLQEAGLSQPQAVLFLYALTGIFGGAALFLQSRGKLIALIVLVLVMLAIVASILAIYKRQGKKYE